MKRFFAVLLVAVVCGVLFATQFHSVPLDNEAYRVIELGELRGIIEPQTDVKPYNLNTVRRLLGVMRDSNLVSSSEKACIDEILASFDSQYGLEDGSVSQNDKSSIGFFRSSSGFGTTTLGGNVSTVQIVGLGSNGKKVFDSRNSMTAYINGNLFNAVSYDLNFKLNLDRIDPNAYLPTELLFSTDGFYMDLFANGDRLKSLPDGRIFLGIEAFPEISTSIRDVVSMRIGAVKRDWGPGVNNFAVAGSARVFDGFELSLTPATWFSYSVMTASLGQASLDSVNGIEWPSESMDKKTGKYSNNISMHRVEIGPFYGVKFGVWESVVWRKRFELSYLNPLAIYMFSQNSLGDYDNVLAGLDFSYTNPRIGELYGAFSFDELYSFSKPFSCARNIIALQAGAKFSLPFGNFSELRTQVTYVSAFFGTHYEDKAKLFADVPYTTAYVNKGQNIGYPLNPDSLEFLLAFDTTIDGGWKLSTVVKDQMRSAQYATKKTGTDILTFMNYGAFDSFDGEKWGQYYSRDFFGNIWNNIVDIEVEVEKSFPTRIPMSVIVGLNGMIETSRAFEPEIVSAYEKQLVNKEMLVEGKKVYVKEYEYVEVYKYNPGKITSWGDWETDFTLNLKIGVKLAY